MATHRLLEKICRQHEFRLATILPVAALTMLSACASKTEHVQVKLKDGTEVTGELVRKEASSMTVVTSDGVARTVLTRQVQTVQTLRPAPAAPAAQPSVATGTNPTPTTGPDKTPPPAVPAAASAFVAPGTGKMTLLAGTTLSFRPRQSMDTAEAIFKTVYVAQLLDDVKLEGGVIPVGTNFTMEVTAQPNSALRAMTCSLMAVYPGGQEYRPVMARTDDPLPVLGTLRSPPASDLPPAQRDIPYRIPASAVFTFKLEKSISLRAAK